jgi:hypothetical protein
VTFRIQPQRCRMGMGRLTQVPEIMEVWYPSNSMPYARWTEPVRSLDSYTSLPKAILVTEREE